VNVRRSRIAEATLVALTVAAIAFGVAAALRVVGFENLGFGRGEAAQQPIGFDDYALQFYYGRLGAENLRAGGVTFGYDPRFLAGYPKTPIYYPSSKPYEYLFSYFPRSDPGTVFNRTIFAMLALIPFILYGAAANFGMSRGERLAVVAMGCLPHFLVPSTGFYAIMEAAGMVSFIFASFLSVYVVSLVDRFLERGEALVGATLLAVAPWLYRSHLTAVVVSALPIAIVYLRRFRATPWPRHAWLILVALAILVANWSWIEGYLLYSHYSDLSEYYTPGGSKHFVPEGGWLAPFEVHVASPKLVSLVPPIFACVGLLAWWRAKRRALFAAFAPQIAFLFFVSYYGIHVGLNAIAPARITLPLAVFVFFPAAHGIALVATRLVAAFRRALPLAPHWAAPIGLSAIAGVALVVSGLPAKAWRPYTLPKLEEHEGLTEHGMALVRWLETNTDGSGRLLHEGSDDRVKHQYYGSHMPAWIPYFSDIQVAGGPAPNPLLKHNYLRFAAGSLTGRPIERIPARELRQLLRLYNVRWVLAWSPTSKYRLNRLGFVTRVEDYEKFTLFRVDTEPSWFLVGSGEASLDGSKIALRNVEAENGEIAIKYHWLESLRTDPPRAIEPRFALDDPVPFIAIQDPPREIVIYNDYDYGLGDSEP